MSPSTRNTPDTRCRELAADGQDEAYIRPPERFMPESTVEENAFSVSGRDMRHGLHQRKHLGR
jgi:hypothetical protein